MYLRRHATHLEVLAPAKINLFLEVLSKRPDGFHEIRTIFTAVSVYDTVVFTPTEEPELLLDCRWAHGLRARDVAASKGQLPARELLSGEIPHGPENLGWRAAAFLRKHAGVSMGARICLIKRIPAAAGLGGASSDAAAVLVAANAGWKLGLSQEQLRAAAAELGSDVPFFLTGRTALARGRGEQLESLRSAPLQVVIVKPPIGLPTARVYARCQPCAASPGPGRLTALLAEGKAPQAAAEMVNHLQVPASQLTPWIERLQQEFQKQPVPGHQMSGSGSSYFAICRNARQARRIASIQRARNIGWVRSATSAVNV